MGQLRTFSCWATKDFLLGLMCAGASCPISLRALGQLRTFSWGSCAQGPDNLFSGCTLLASHSALHVYKKFRIIFPYCPLSQSRKIKKSRFAFSVLFIVLLVLFL